MCFLCVCILSRIPRLCGSVTNNSTWIRIGYRIYSLWRLTATHITITDYWHNSQLNTRWMISLDQVLQLLLITDFSLRRLCSRTDLFCLQTLTLCCVLPSPYNLGLSQWKHSTTVARQPCNAIKPSGERIHVTIRPRLLGNHATRQYRMVSVSMGVFNFRLPSKDGIRPNTSQYKR
jgi:hypothetical protein